MTDITAHLLHLIIESKLSDEALKLATVILVDLTTVEHFDTCKCNAATFKMDELAKKTGVSPQNLSALLTELGTSPLRLTGWQTLDNQGVWHLRFNPSEMAPKLMGRQDDQADLLPGDLEMPRGHNGKRPSLAFSAAQKALPSAARAKKRRRQ